MCLAADFRVADDLRHAGMIAHIQKDDVPQVPAAINPAGQKNGLPRVLYAKLAAVMRPLSVTKKVQFQVHRRKTRWLLVILSFRAERGSLL
jgi:hypothetical protein